MSAAEKVVKLETAKKPWKRGQPWTEEMKSKARATRALRAGERAGKLLKEPQSVRTRDAKLYLADAERRLAQIELPVKASRQMKTVRALLVLAMDSLEE